VLATPAALEPLVQLASVADRVLDTDGLGPLGWDGPAPEVAVNLHGKGPQSHRALAALDPRRLAAFGCAEAAHPGPAWDPDEHEVRRWCRLVEATLGVPADPGDLLLEPPQVPAPAPGAVVVHPGAAYPSRRWPVERFAAVARWAAGRGHRVVVTGGPGEVALAGEVAHRAGLPAEDVLAGRTGLVALATQVASARLLVCGDTGVAHLASAYRTPSVLLFGPTAPRRWGPPADGPHAVLWHGTGEGDPWGSQVDPALARIDVGEVLERAERLLGLSAPARTTPGFA
jgi:ADP-heptose:LPS heptosyltransferase